MTGLEFLFFPARERRPGRIFLRKRFLETTALSPAALYDRWMVAMKERQHFLDVLRVAAACAVVLMHTVTAVTDNMDMSPYPAAQKLFPVVRDLVSWCVPVFILISGYLFLRPDRNLTFGRMVTKYCRRIVLALFLFGVPYSWVELAVTEGGFRTGMLWQGIVNVLRRQSWAHMWYLYLILFLYLLTPAIRWMLERVPKTALYALAAALLFGSSILPFICQLRGIPQTSAQTAAGELIYLFYYLCGYFFACSEKRRRGLRSFLICFSALLGVCAAILRFQGFPVQMAYNYPFTVLLSLCLFGAGLAWEGEKAGCPPKHAAFWAGAGKLCFGVYLIHPVFINLAYKYFKVSPLTLWGGASLPLFYGAVLAVSFGGAWLLRRIPTLRRYVL